MPLLLLAVLTGATADVDRALRARIEQFYEYNVRKEYRKAEALAAPDSRDYYYNSPRPSWVSYRVVSVTYSSDAQRAEALVNVERVVPFPGFLGKPMKFQDRSYWKRVRGEWWWYVDPSKSDATPFGNMTGSNKGGGSLPAVPTSLEEFYGKIKAAPAALTLPANGSGQVTISNGTSGPIVLALPAQTAGLKASLDRTRIAAGGHAVVTVHAGQQSGVSTVEVLVEPIGHKIEIPVTVR